MGAVCSSGLTDDESSAATAEKNNRNAFVSVDEDGDDGNDVHYFNMVYNDKKVAIESDEEEDDGNITIIESEQELLMEEDEQTRLDALVITTSRNMMPVNKGSMFNSQMYYDYTPNYAMLLPEKLFTRNTLSGVGFDMSTATNTASGVSLSNGKENYNESSNNSIGLSVSPQSVIDILSRGRWDSIDLSDLVIENTGNQRPISLDLFFDECAESFMAASLPTRTLFEELKPIVDNL